MHQVIPHVGGHCPAGQYTDNAKVIAQASTVPTQGGALSLALSLWCCSAASLLGVTYQSDGVTLPATRGGAACQVASNNFCESGLKAVPGQGSAGKVTPSERR